MRFLATHAVSGRVRRELYAVEAEAAILMGQLVWDASQRRDHTSAQMYLNQAIQAARQVRDPATGRACAATQGHDRSLRGTESCRKD